MSKDEQCPGCCNACELDCEFQMQDVPTVPEIAIDNLLEDIINDNSYTERRENEGTY